MRNTLFKLNSSKIFQFSVIFIIILNAITVGISTYDLNPIIKIPFSYLIMELQFFLS